MIDIHAKYFTCQHGGCEAVPTVKLVGDDRASQCKKHYKEVEGEQVLPKGDGRFQKICVTEDCKRIARWKQNKEVSHFTQCLEHRLPGMISKRQMYGDPKTWASSCTKSWTYRKDENGQKILICTDLTLRKASREYINSIDKNFVDLLY